MYPNVENMIIVPIRKRTEISTGIQVCHFTDKLRKMVEKKAFLEIPRHQYRVSQKGEHDCSANNQKNGDYYEYPCFSRSTDKL